MSIVPMSVSYLRSQAVDFSEFLIVDEHRLVFRRPTPEADVAAFVKPFTMTVRINTPSDQFLVLCIFARPLN